MYWVCRYCGTESRIIDTKKRMACRCCGKDSDWTVFQKARITAVFEELLKVAGNVSNGLLKAKTGVFHKGQRIMNWIAPVMRKGLTAACFITVLLCIVSCVASGRKNWFSDYKSTWKNHANINWKMITTKVEESMDREKENIELPNEKWNFIGVDFSNNMNVSYVIRQYPYRFSENVTLNMGSIETYLKNLQMNTN